MLRVTDFSPKQLELLNAIVDGNNDIISDGPARCGKSTTCGYGKVLRSTMFKKPTNFLLFGPSLGQIKENQLKFIYEAAEGLGLNIVEHKDNAGYAIIGIHKFWCRVAKQKNDQDSLLGMELSGAWGDEVTACRPEFIDAVYDRFSNPEHTPIVVLTCNPKGPKDYIKREFIDGDRGYDRIRLTIDDNPYLSEERKAFLWSKYNPVQRERMYKGNWFAQDGLVFPKYSLMKKLPQHNPEDTLRFVSIDVGESNPTHAIMVEYIAGKFIVTDELRIDNDEIQHTFPVQAKKIMNWVSGRKIARWIIDSAAAAMKAQIAEDFSIVCTNANKDVARGIQVTNAMLTNETVVVHKRCNILIEELESYAYDKNKLQDSIEVPEKGNDHAVDTLRYFCASLGNAPIRYERSLKI